MNPLAKFNKRRYSSLNPLERQEIEHYVLKVRGHKLGSRINKSMDNIGSKKKTLSVVSVFNRAEEYHRRQREDDV
jgi:hypothetical protein